MTPADWSAVRLTALLAGTTTLLLLGVGAPLAWWLARTRSRLKPVMASVVALPLVLPPSVLGWMRPARPKSSCSDSTASSAG